ncbi:MAG: hypothetical protein ABJB76_08525 [Candidatus Nitrosocosmicus sp.]
MSKNTTNSTEYSYNTTNQNNHDFKESVNRSFDETKDNIKKSLDESKNQIPRYNTIVNNYQEQTLQTAKEISEEYIESQKSIINSLSSAWKPYNESFNVVVNSWNSPDSVVKAYSRFVSNVADNAVSAMRLTNNMIFSNLDSWKSVLEQAKDNSRHISNLNVNAAKTFEQNSKEVRAAAVKDANTNVNTETTVSNTSQQSSNKKI